MTSRDEFYANTKKAIAARVGYICSNPDCSRMTSGPDTDPEKFNNTGKAAHICAAASNGPRYDKNQTPKQRRSASNGIWLCAYCADLVDKDIYNFPVELLIEWKRSAENAAKVSIGKTRSKSLNHTDAIIFIGVCLRRPAFEDHFYQERSEPDFLSAIQDTIAAFNTGRLYSRNKNLVNEINIQHLYEVRKKYKSIDSIYRALKDIMRVMSNQRGRDVINDEMDLKFMTSHSAASYIDDARKGIILEYNEVARECGLSEIYDSY